MNMTQMIKASQNLMKYSALGLAVAVMLGVGTAQADPGLNVRTYSGIDSQALLAPISNLMGNTPTATGTQTTDINYGNFATLPGPPPAEHFSVLWEGWLNVTVDGTGIYTFATASDDGSMLYLDSLARVRQLDGI